MKTFRILLIGISFFIGCNFSEKLNNEHINLLGEWASNIKPSQGNIIIKKDSIYYPFYNCSFFYSLKGDSIKIFFLDKTYEAKYILVKDSLFLQSEDGIDTSFRK